MKNENDELKTGFIVSFREKGEWFEVTKKPVTREEAEDIYNKNTYYGQCHCLPQEEIFFQIREVTII